MLKNRLPDSCSGCPLSTNPLCGKFTSVEGRGGTGVLVVAEASGRHEAAAGLPLRRSGESGAIWEKALRRAGFERERDFWITNVVRCRPPKNWLEHAPWERDAIDHCKPNLDEVVERLKPRAILALGGVAFREISGRVGKKQSLADLANYVLTSRYPGIPVVGIYHPAFIARGETRFLGQMMEAIHRAVGVAGGRYPGPVLDPRTVVLAKTTLEDLYDLYEEARERPEMTIAYDVETDDSSEVEEDANYEFSRDSERDVDGVEEFLEEPERIESNDGGISRETGNEGGFGSTKSLDIERASLRTVQFAIRKEEGVSIAYDEGSRELIDLILGLPNPKVAHNGLFFDDRILERHGHRIEGQRDDTLLAFRTVQPDLPGGLQKIAHKYGQLFPWKHMAGSHLEFYGCMSRTTQLELWGGGTIEVGTVVNNKQKVLLKGMDEDGTIIPVEVVGWRVKPGVDASWLDIKTEVSNKMMTLTDDHKVWTPAGWVEAGKLSVGDRVKIARKGSADLIHGILLGDGGVDSRGRLKFTHCEDQLDWFNAKRQALDGPTYFREAEVHMPIRGREVRSSDSYITEVWISPSIWRNKFRPFGKKWFVAPSDKALAIWYGDDGCWAGANSGFTGNPRIYCFYENIDEALAWFKEEFGEENISFYADKRSPQGGAIAMIGEGRRLFWERIAPLLHPSMERKLPPEYRGKYNGWMEIPEAQWSVIKSIKHNTRRSARYDITVDHPTHRFFTTGGLVENCVDVTVLHLVWPGIQQQLTKWKLWDAYREMRLRFRKEVTEPMELRGIPMDRGRLDEFRGELQTEVDGILEKIVELVPPELNNYVPYKVMPPGIKDLVYERHPEFSEPVVKVYKNGKSKLVKNPTKVSDVYRLLLEAWMARGGEGDSSPLVDTMEEVFRQNGELRFHNGGLATFEAFNPASWQQLLKYIKLKGYRVPADFKTGKPTTGAKELKRLQVETGDEVIAGIQELRKVEKLMGSYTGKLQEDGSVKGGWYPAEDGRLRATIGETATGQLAAKNPNTMTLVKKGERAKKFRRCIVAEPGHAIVAFDYKSFHDLTTALEAGDEVKFRVATMDPHAYVAAHLVKFKGYETALSMNDADLGEWLKEVKAAHPLVREYQGKPANHGTNFGQGYKRLYHEYEEHFRDEGAAKRVLDQMRTIFPKTFKWQDEVVEEADQGFLINKWGWRRWIYDAMAWKMDSRGKWKKVNGRDAEKAKAYKPASNAHGMMRYKLLRMAGWGWLEKYELINTVHDSMEFHCPIPLLDECIQMVGSWLQAPVIQLAHPIIAPSGFSCRVDPTVGPDRLEMTEVKIERIWEGEL